MVNGGQLIEATWPFDDPENLVVITADKIMDKVSPILVRDSTFE